MPIDSIPKRNYDKLYGNNQNNSNPKVSNTNADYNNAVFSDKEKDGLKVEDFFNLMLAQLTNQDFMNPVDDTQYLSQLAQFASMQQMMELGEYSKQNYIMSMMGKYAVAGENKVGGTQDITEGYVEKISIEKGEYRIFVNGKPFSPDQIKQLYTSKQIADEEKMITEMVNGTQL